eukprot:gene61405-81849_t
MLIRFIVALLAASAATSALSSTTKVMSDADEVIPCSKFDPKSIKLITFDVFAALMDLDTSLIVSVTKILPSWTSAQVKSLVSQWENAYGNLAGTVFDENITGPQPFQWMLSTTLTTILESMSVSVTDDERALLIQAWGILTPWVNTQEVLTQLYNANFTLGALSNGDRGTLTTAMKVFLPAVSFTYIFPSDFPTAGSFKPDAAMYHQIKTTTGITASEMLHVAGANIDGWGARNAGLFSALLGRIPYPQLPLPCFMLKDITELPAVLGL